MSAKTIFIIIIAVLMTIILMKNTDEVDFWLFGDTRLPKLAVLGFVFFTGLIVGYILARPRKKLASTDNSLEDLPKNSLRSDDRDYLSDEDREYIR